MIGGNKITATNDNYAIWIRKMFFLNTFVAKQGHKALDTVTYDYVRTY